MGLTHFSLFSGIGGMDLAAEWAGFETIGQVEIADYPYRVLCKHWPSVPKWRDVRDVTSGSVRETGINHITVLSGGFPCQPFSCAGKRRGKEDDRYLWHEMFRVITELRPTWVIGENVAGIINMGLDSCISDLEGEGYSVRCFTIPACAVKAPHRRERVFILAHSGHDVWVELQVSRDNEQAVRDSAEGQIRGVQLTGSGCGERGTEDVAYSNSIIGQSPMRHMERGRTVVETVEGIEESCRSSETPREDVANSHRQGLQGYGRQYQAREGASEWLTWTGSVPLEGVWESEPDVGRVVNGVPARVDRLKCLGNAVVPQQVYPIFKAIAEIESAQSN